MPAIPDHLLNAVFYLYPSAVSARKGAADAGGTGFFVALKSTCPELGHHVYAVSNQHVVCNSPVIRLNTEAGDTRPLLADVADWEPHPKGDDVAVLPIDMKEQSAAFQDVDIKITTIDDNQFAFKERISEYQIGVGEDVFMIGRFGPHDGALRNKPSVRFGHISMMADEKSKVRQTGRQNFSQESFCVDMHSLFGYSGSPVFAYRSRINIHLGPTPPPPRPPLMYLLLGVHWGSLWDEVKDTNKDKTVHTHSGINGVVPVWKLWELLQTPKLVAQREEQIVKYKENHPGSAGAVLESATSASGRSSVANIRDGMLGAMLSQPPQPRKQSARKPVKRK